MPLAMRFSTVVLPALGGLTIRPRWPDRREQVDHARRDDIRPRLQQNLIVREDRCHLLEDGALFGLLWIETVDRFHFQQAVIFLGLLWWAHLPNDQVTRAQSEATNLALADVHVLRPWQQMVATQEADILLHNLQDTSAENEASLFGAGAQQTHDEVVLFQPRISCDISRARDLTQFVKVEVFQLSNRHLFQGNACIQHILSSFYEKLCGRSRPIIKWLSGCRSCDESMSIMCAGGMLQRLNTFWSLHRVCTNRALMRKIAVRPSRSKYLRDFNYVYSNAVYWWE